MKITRHPRGLASTTMNGKIQNIQSPVGAMKIARTPTVSECPVEWHQPPGSLPEGAVERSETEGVYFGERKSSKISEFICADV